MTAHRPGTAALPWRTAWRIARTELSWRFRGLRLLMICLFLGVAALAAVGTLTQAVQQGLANHGRAILGGDLEATVWQRPLTPDERQFLSSYGTLSEGTRLQATAQATNTASPVPVQLKAVDAHWPLVGTLTLADGGTAGALHAGTAWLSPGAAARLSVTTGARITLSGTPVTVGGIIAEEPDALGEGFALGPTVIVAASLPSQAGLTAPGALYRTRARLACAPARPCDPAAIAAAIKARFPSNGFEIRDAAQAANLAGGFVGKMGDFLTLVGLAALLIAGLGIGGGTASYLETRQPGIATLKVLGATSQDIARIYRLQIGAAALAASLAGLITGAAAVPLIEHFLAGTLPITPGFTLAALPLARAAGFGLATALIFAAPPLSAARAFPAMALLRARVEPPRTPWRQLVLPIAAGLASIALLAFIGSAAPRTTAIFLGGAAALFALLALLGAVIRAVAARLPRPRNPIAALALANLHRPGAQTTRLVTALGFGLAAFVLLAVVDTGLAANIDARVPAIAPDYFLIDLPPERLPGLTADIHAKAPAARIRAVPMLRGAILAYGPPAHITRVANLAHIPDDAWALKGERGLTFSDTIPEGNRLTEGRWWPSHYTGPPLVSVDAKLAQTIGLHLGDTVIIGILGVERSATVASFRHIEWASYGFNNVLVFSPNALSDAPYKLAASVQLGEHEKKPATKAALLRLLATRYPLVSVIETGLILHDARSLLDEVATAIFAAACVAVLAGIAVLLGAIAAARAARQYDTVILRLLGASQRQILGLIVAEFAGLSVLLAGFALAVGAALGWLVLVALFGFEFLPSWPRVLAVLAAGIVLVLGFALAASLPLLRTRPAEALRAL